jgi:hypothetical protein
MNDPDPLPKARTSRRRSVVFSLLFLLLGALIGSGATAVLIVGTVHERVRDHLHHPERFVPRATERLRRRLGLTDEQAEQVAVVLATRQGEILELRRGFQPQVEFHLKELETDIAALLTPEQQEEWRVALDRVRDFWLAPLPTAGEDP